MIRLALGLTGVLVVLALMRRVQRSVRIPELEYDPYAIPFGDIGHVPPPTVSAALN